jgi:hypothetical protein
MVRPFRPRIAALRPVGGSVHHRRVHRAAGLGYSPGVRIPLLTIAALSGLCTPAARAQCLPGPNSNEAKLLAFFSAPIAFSTLEAPVRRGPWHVEISGELTPVRTASPSIEHATICYNASAKQHSRLTSVFARPRIEVTLPYGLAVEASYIPPIQIGDAHPHLGSAAISETAPLPAFGPFRSVALMVRAHGTIGRVHGPITCSAPTLQQSEPDSACYGTRESDDRFNPTMYGLEGVVGASSRGGRFDFFAGSGVTWLRPRFEVDFTSVDGTTDNTRVEVNLERWAVLAGATVHLPASFAVTTELYSVPRDITTWRAAVSYRIR